MRDERCPKHDCHEQHRWNDQSDAIAGDQTQHLRACEMPIFGSAGSTTEGSIFRERQRVRVKERHCASTLLSDLAIKRTAWITARHPQPGTVFAKSLRRTTP